MHPRMKEKTIETDLEENASDLQKLMLQNGIKTKSTGISRVLPLNKVVN